MADAAALTVKAVHDGRICALTLSGELDLTTAAEFLEHVARAVDDRTERFVLDLAGLAFLDCTGARALVLAAYAAPSGCPVIIRSISPLAARLIGLLDLDLRHLWQEPPCGPGGLQCAGTAGAAGRSHSAERPHIRKCTAHGSGVMACLLGYDRFVPG